MPAIKGTPPVATTVGGGGSEAVPTPGRRDPLEGSTSAARSSRACPSSWAQGGGWVKGEALSVAGRVAKDGWPWSQWVMRSPCAPEDVRPSLGVGSGGGNEGSGLMGNVAMVVASLGMRTGRELIRYSGEVTKAIMGLGRGEDKADATQLGG